jgi:hypothetical protein
VLRLQGSGLCDLKLDRCVASDQIDIYLQPDGRSRITSPSIDALRKKINTKNSHINKKHLTINRKTNYS